MKALLKAISLAAVLAASAALAEAPGTTENPADVTIENVRVVFDREESILDVKQFFSLRSVEGRTFSRPSGFPIPLPDRAFGPAALDQDETVRIAVDRDRVRVETPIPPTGLLVSVRYKLPIANGRAVLDQRLGKVGTAEAYSNWTEGGAALEGEGFTPAEAEELSNGILANAIFCREVAGGRLQITLSGLAPSAMRGRAIGTLVLSVLAFAIGLVFWIRARRAERRENPAQGAP